MQLNEPLKPPGTGIWEYLTALVECNPSILALSIVTYREPPDIRQRAFVSPTDVKRLESALRLRERDGIPLWDAVMLSCFNQYETAEGLLRAALFHQSMKENWKFLPRSTVLGSCIEQLLMVADTVIAIGSALKFKNREDLHLPLLDFHCRESEDNDRLVASVCRLLFGGKTVVCRSGESYHAYGLTAVTHEELRRFLSTALLFAPIVDRAYVAHQLMEGKCALRISSTQTKPMRPKVKFIVRPKSVARSISGSDEQTLSEVIDRSYVGQRNHT